MASLKDLLSKGYFPREIPPPFFTRRFAETVTELPLTGLPASFTRSKADTWKFVSHNLARVGTLRRPLGIPNPAHYFSLCREIEQQWSDLETYFAKAKVSLSVPTIAAHSQRAISPKESLEHRPTHRASVRAVSRYILQADISRFYPSLYTHSIPWALHGKAVVKAKKFDPKLAGNKLDTIVRRGQDGQTIGVPIGPDASLVLAELVLCAVDAVFPRKMVRGGFRFIDDYEFGFSTYADAEEGLALLQGQLNEFQLALNPKKTNIVDLPQPLETKWVSELRIFPLGDDGNTRAQEFGLIRYFERAFELADEHPEDTVLKYAIGRSRSFRVRQKNWVLFQDLLLQCATGEAGSLPFVTEQLLRYHQAGYRVSKTKLTAVTNSIIEMHSHLGHGSEVAWALWLALIFQLKIRNNVAKKLGKVSDSVVAILALDARAKGLIGLSVDLLLWENYMTTDQLDDDQWLLSYEANVKGWLPSVGRGDHVARHPAFGFLKTNGVFFYNDKLAGQLAQRKRKLVLFAKTDTQYYGAE